MNTVNQIAEREIDSSLESQPIAPNPSKIQHKNQKEQKKEQAKESASLPEVSPEDSQPVTTQVQHVKAGTKFKVNAPQGTSQILLERFQQAIDDTEATTTVVNESKNNNDIDLESARIDNRSDFESADTTFDPALEDSKQIRSVTEMPEWVQNGLPTLQFDMHIYASDGQGWVRVNGRDRYEGDYINKELFLNKILPQKVIFTYRGEKFSMPALSSW
jgi:hypothetical protein